MVDILQRYAIHHRDHDVERRTAFGLRGHVPLVAVAVAEHEGVRVGVHLGAVLARLLPFGAPRDEHHRACRVRLEALASMRGGQPTTEQLALLGIEELVKVHQELATQLVVLRVERKSRDDCGRQVAL